MLFFLVYYTNRKLKREATLSQIIRLHAVQVVTLYIHLYFVIETAKTNQIIRQE